MAWSNQRTTLPQSRPLGVPAPSEREPGMGAHHPTCRSEAATLRAIFIAPTKLRNFHRPKKLPVSTGKTIPGGPGHPRMGTGPKRNRKNPQGVWIVEKNFVENRGIHSGAKTAVNNLCLFTNPMWIKSPRPLRAFATFPHKFPLLPLLLPQPIYR